MQNAKTSLKEFLIAQLTNEAVRLRFEELLNALNDLSNEDRGRLELYFQYKLDFLLTLVRDLVIDSDETELDFQLKNIWLSFRLEWNLLNLQMQYQTMQLGQAKAFLSGQGAILSYLIELIEEPIDAQTMSWLYRLATDPVQAASYKNILAQKMMDVTLNAEKTVSHTVSKLNELKHLSSQEMNDRSIITRSVDDIIQSVTKTISIDVSDLNEMIELVINKTFVKCPIRYALNNRSPANCEIRPEFVKAAVQIIKVWVETMVTRSLEPSKHEREAKGKNHHVNLDWKVETTSGETILTLRDDSNGVIEFEFDESLYDLVGLRVSKSLIGSGDGSELKIFAPSSPLEEYIVFQLPQGIKPWVAISCAQLFTVLNDTADSSIQKATGIIQAPDGQLYSLINARQSAGLKLVKETAENSDSRHCYILLQPIEGKRLAYKASAVGGIVQATLTKSGGAVSFPGILGFIRFNDLIVGVLDAPTIRDGVSHAAVV